MFYCHFTNGVSYSRGCFSDSLSSPDVRRDGLVIWTSGNLQTLLKFREEEWGCWHASGGRRSLAAMTEMTPSVPFCQPTCVLTLLHCQQHVTVTTGKHTDVLTRDFSWFFSTQAIRTTAGVWDAWWSGSQGSGSGPEPDPSEPDQLEQQLNSRALQQNDGGKHGTDVFGSVFRQS